MNEDQTYVGEEHRTSMRSALIAVVACVAVLAITYYFFGNKISESVKFAKEAQQTPQVNTVQTEESPWPVVDVEGRQHYPVVTEVGEQHQSLIPLTVVSPESREAAIAARAASQAKLIAAQSVVNDCDAALRELQTAIQEWDQQYAGVLDDDRGRRFASDPVAVEKLATQFQQPLAGNDKLAIWTQELNAIAEPIRNATASGDEFHVTEELRTYLQEILTQVTDAHNRHASLQKLIDSLTLSTQSQQLAEVTLREAIASYERRLVDELSADATKRRAEELKKSLEAQSAAITEAEKRRIDAETEAKVTEEEARRQGILENTEVLKDKLDEAAAIAAKQKLEAEFRREQSEITSVLFPFLDTNGESQPRFGPIDDPRSWHFPGQGLGPTSFSRLSASGALEDSADGNRRLYFLGGDFNNLRRKGGFPSYVATGLNDRGVLGRVQRARELLVKYGELMVEKGMLQR